MPRLRLLASAAALAIALPLAAVGPAAASASPAPAPAAVAAAAASPVVVSISTNGTLLVTVRAPANSKAWRVRVGTGNRSLQATFTRSGSGWTGRLVWYLKSSSGLKVVNSMNLTAYLRGDSRVGGCYTAISLCALTFQGFHLPTSTGPFLRMSFAPLGQISHLTITGAALIRSGGADHWVQGNYVSFAP